jgi:ATP-binding cassette subfamily B protein
MEFVPDVRDTGRIELEQFESLQVRDLWFRYPGALDWALKGVSFTLRQGETLGVVGETGSGKTTLIEILSRQYPITQGEVLVNGHALEEITLSSLRKIMAIVPQEAFLFSRKVAENVAFSRDEWILPEVQEAASMVSLDQEIESWPMSYDALVGERGVNLSGGQKQRMTLARALMKNGELAILDDSLSAVDGRTEMAILTILRNELKKTSAIVVSHRLSSILWADQILVLNNGAMEGLGTHQKLLHESPTYQSLFKIQTAEMQKEVRT